MGSLLCQVIAEVDLQGLLGNILAGIVFQLGTSFNHWALIRLLTNFTITGLGAGSTPLSSGVRVTICGGTPSGPAGPETRTSVVAGGFPRWWAPSMSSIFSGSCRMARIFSSTCPWVSSGRLKKTHMDPLCPCCSWSSAAVFKASTSYVRLLMMVSFSAFCCFRRLFWSVSCWMAAYRGSNSGCRAVCNALIVSSSLRAWWM